MWLHGTRGRLVEFDLQTLPYSTASRALVEGRFPGRATFHVGSSKLTVAAYAARVRAGSSPPCDLWMIDSDHGIGTRHDMRNALAASHAGTVVVADDATAAFRLVRKFWRMHVVHRSIRQLACAQLYTTRGARQLKGWCVGTVEPWVVAEGGAAALESKYMATLKMDGGALEAAYAAALNDTAGRPGAAIMLPR